MTQDEMQKQILDAISSGKIAPTNIVLGDMVDKKIIVGAGGIGVQNNYYTDKNLTGNSTQDVEDALDEERAPITKTRGPRKQLLFRNEDGEKDELRTKEEASRVQKYLSDHHLGKEKLDSSVGSKLNKIVATFWLRWKENGYVNYLFEGAAFYRFLTEDCNIECTVDEKAFVRAVRGIIDSGKRDPEIYANVASYFENN